MIVKRGSSYGVVAPGSRSATSRRIRSSAAVAFVLPLLPRRVPPRVARCSPGGISPLQRAAAPRIPRRASAADPTLRRLRPPVQRAAGRLGLRLGLPAAAQDAAARSSPSTKSSRCRRSDALALCISGQRPPIQQRPIR
jgi:hypothetical protein